MRKTHAKERQDRFRSSLSAVICGGMIVSGVLVTPVHAASIPSKPGSNVAYSKLGYERDQVLEVAGKPFFYNGVQIRIDKVKDVYGYTDEQIKNLFKRAKDDGFTVANVQIRWSDIQPDTPIDLKESATISEKVPDAVQTGNLKLEGSSNDAENLTYLKFDVSNLPNTVEAAKLRIFLPDAQNNLTMTHKLTAYDITNQTGGTNFSQLTWNNAPVKNVTGLTGVSTDSYDPVKNSSFYDIDVTELVNGQLAKGNESAFMLTSSTTDGENAESIVIDKGAYAPQLIVSEDKAKYDWTYLDKILSYAEEADIKIELLWFATDTVSITADNRVPFYVFHNYEESMADVNKPFLSKRTGAGDAVKAYGVYWYLMNKNDKNLQQQEGSSIKAMFNHVAEYNISHGNKNIVIGAQVANEPQVSKLHSGSAYDFQGNKVPHSMDANSLALKAQLGLSDQGFRDYTMFQYTNNLAKAVKTSNYPVWTRVNNIQGTDAWGVTYNENRRKSGGTNTDAGTYLDFIGLDPYGWGRPDLYGFGRGSYATGENLPMVMESGGEKSMTALMALATIAGGAYYNVYDLVSPDGHAMYNEDMSPRVIAAGDKYLPNGGTYINDIRGTNNMLNQIADELATKNPNSLGGKDLLFFNAEGTDTTNINVTRQIGGIDVTYKSDTKFSVGIAVKRSEKEIVLQNTLDENATFTLKGISEGGVKSVTSGRYDTQSLQWSEDNTASYQGAGNSVVLTLPKYSSVIVTLNEPIPVPPVFEFESETLDDNGKVTFTNTMTKNNYDDPAAHAGGWLIFNNVKLGNQITFKVNVPSDLSAAQVVTGYKAGSGRGSVQLTVNGQKYGAPIDMTSGTGYTTTAPGGIAALIPGQENTFTYTATKDATYLTFDYIKLIKSPSMPPEMGGGTLIDEDFSQASGTFGFGTGASISNGTLKLTQGMGNYTTSIKNFESNIARQSAVDLTFDWSTAVTSSGKKTGIEFRDPYGRLIFAFSGANGGTELRHSVTGWDSDSSHSQFNWEPTWSKVPFDRTKTYTVRLVANFDQKTVSYSIKEKGGSALVQEINIPTQATGLAKMVAANYYTDGAAGTQTIDNFKLIAPTEQLDLPLVGKKIYAFGDSIIDGHKYNKAGFVDFVAAYDGMNLLYNDAKNGATIMPGGLGGQILSQITNAPVASPDFIVFDGGTFDAYESNDNRWGTVGNSKDPSALDTNTVAGAFENIISQMKQKWPQAKIIYVAVHKLADGRTVERQDILHEIQLAASEKWGVYVANLYDNSELNTRAGQEFDTNRWEYTFDDLGSDGLPGTLATRDSSEFDSDTPSGTYPNFRGIEEFYVPIVSQTLHTSLSNIDEVAPVTTDDAPTGWQAKDIVVKLTASDVGSGVEATYYKVDTGSIQIGNMVSITSEGSHIITYWSVDLEGNVEEQHNVEVNIDKTAPSEATIVADVTSPTSNDVTITISYSDDVTVREYKVGDNGAWTAYGAPVIVSENVTVYARGTDAAGNISNVTSYVVGNIDHIAPEVASLVVDTTAPTNQGVAVTIIYPGDADVMEYKVGDNGEWQAYTSPVIVSDNETVFARGTDAVGNVSNVTSIMVGNIYKIAPVTTATLTPAAPNGKNSWYTADVTVCLAVYASVYGGMVTTEYQVNDGGWITYNGSIPVFEDGTYKLNYRSKDQAGNVENIHTIEFKVDKTAPALSVQLDKASIWPANHKMVIINVMLNANDALSGVESVVLISITSNVPDSAQGDIQAAFGAAATSFRLRAEKSRIYTITYTATDKAGNKTVKTAIVSVPHDQSNNNSK